MKNLKKTKDIEGDISRAELESTIAPVLDYEQGLVLVTGPAGRGKTTIINALIGIELDRGGRGILAVDYNGENTEVKLVDKPDSPSYITGEHDPFDDFSEMIEYIDEAEPEKIFIDRTGNEMNAVLAVALARQGYPVFAGIEGDTPEAGAKNLEEILGSSEVFAEWATGFEGLKDGSSEIVGEVLVSEIFVNISMDATKEA